MNLWKRLAGILLLLLAGPGAHSYHNPDPTQQVTLAQEDPGQGPAKLSEADIIDYSTQHAHQKWRAKTPLELYGKSDPEKFNKTLLPLFFQPLPLGSIKPRGWFRDQLQLMADGLPGRMHEFYEIVKDAKWLGGDAEYSALNEAWPYYINGLIPLAYSLDDHRLKRRVEREVGRVLQLQSEDGWLGPERDASDRNFWARYPLFLGLAQLAEVAESEERTVIIKAMHRFVDLMHKMLEDDYQGYVSKESDKFDDQWGRSRAADMIMTLQWLYEKHPDGNGKKLHECMIMLYDMAWDWSYWFREDVYIKEDLDTLPSKVTDALFPYIHGVNAGQGLKFGGVIRRLTHDKTLLNSTRRGVNWTFEYHGASSGAIIGDEQLSGLSPVRGTELCSVVETMFSLSYLYHALGDREFADRAELSAFNALPTMVMPRWWAHQYVAQSNQPLSQELADPPFSNVGPYGQTFGLEPNYPCCTVEFSQGYPKLLSASWVRHGDDGLAHVVLVSSEVTVILPSRNKKHKENRIHVKCKTNYPFAHFLTYTVHATHSFKLYFRVPSWTNTSSSSTFFYLTTKSNRNPQPQPLSPDPHTGLQGITLPRGQSTIEASFSSNGLQIHNRPNKTISISYGTLVYAYSPHHELFPRRPANYPGDLAPPQSNDWTIKPREGDIWNIAIDPNTLRFYAYDNRYDENLPNPIWESSAPPVSISVLACEIDWHLSPVTCTEENPSHCTGGGYAEAPPLIGQRNCTGRAFPVELKPYGSAKIRIAEFPVVDLSPGSEDLYDPYSGTSRKGDDGERTEL